MISRSLLGGVSEEPFYEAWANSRTFRGKSKEFKEYFASSIGFELQNSWSEDFALSSILHGSFSLYSDVIQAS